MLRTALSVLAITLAIWMTPSAHAQTVTSSGGSMYYGGALLGVGFISNNGGTQIDFGLQGGYKIMPPLSLGLYFTYNALAAPVNASSSLLTLAPEANYHITEGMFAGARVGAKLGLAWVRSSVDVPAASGGIESASDSSMSLVVGPALGYDFGLGGGITVGGEANMLFYTANDGFNAINLLGNLKYWF